MATLYMLAALGVVPGLLGFFHWLSRVPSAPAQEAEVEVEAEQNAAEPARAASLAEEAERWLQSQP